MNQNFDTYCGNYCGACSIMVAYRTGNKDSLASHFTEENLRAMLKARGIAVTENDSFELKCHGCKTDTVFHNCKHCKIRGCAGSRNVEHCFDCGEYPCELYHELLLNKDFQQKLPHLKLVQRNLRVIQEVGTEKWLEAQGNLWKCPQCQTKSSWYARTCTHCGEDLTRTKVFNEE